MVRQLFPADQSQGHALEPAGAGGDGGRGPRRSVAVKRFRLRPVGLRRGKPADVRPPYLAWYLDPSPIGSFAHETAGCSTRRMRVLIVGCGYVGLPLGAELARLGHEVYGLR